MHKHLGNLLESLRCRIRWSSPGHPHQEFPSPSHSLQRVDVGIDMSECLHRFYPGRWDAFQVSRWCSKRGGTYIASNGIHMNRLEHPIKNMGYVLNPVACAELCHDFHVGTTQYASHMIMRFWFHTGRNKTVRRTFGGVSGEILY